MARLSADDHSQLRALLDIRRRLALRRFKGRPNEGMATLFFLLLVLPGPWFVSFLSAGGYRRLPDPWNAELLGVILTLLWIIWLVAPIFGAAFNQSFDAVRLLVFPIRPRVMLAAMVLGTFFDVSALISLPFFVAALLSWVDPLTAIIAVPALVVAYASLVTTGQLVNTVTAGLAHSRRLRDVGVVLSGILALAWFWLNARMDGVSHPVKALAERGMAEGIHPLAVLQWTPPGTCVRAVERVHAGDYRAGAAWLAAGIAWLAVLSFLWWRAMVRVTTSGAFELGRRRNAMRPAAVTPLPVPRAGAAGPLRSRPARLAWTDLSLMWRNPMRRMRVIQSVVLPGIIVGTVLRNQLVEPFAVLIPSFFVAMTGMLAFQNLLAADGKGVATVFLSPLPRAELFRAQTLSFAAVIALPVAVLCVILAVIGSPATGLAGGALAVSCFLVLAAVCSGVSARFTFPVTRDGRPGGNEGMSGATMAVGILQPLLVGFLWAPVWITVLIALHHERLLPVVLAAVGGLAYGWIVYRIGIRQAGNALLEREPEHFLTLELGR